MAKLIPTMSKALKINMHGLFYHYMYFYITCLLYRIHSSLIKIEINARYHPV